MKNQVLVKKYAQGLAQAVKDEPEFESVQAALGRFLDIYTGNDELRKALTSPFLNAGTKGRILENVLARIAARDKAARFVSLLLEHKRLDLLQDVSAVLTEAWNEKLGILTFEVASVVPLTDVQKTRLRQMIEAAEKKPVRLVFKIDPGIIGGLAVKRGHIVYDASVQGNLDQMKEQIQQG